MKVVTVSNDPCLCRGDVERVMKRIGAFTFRICQSKHECIRTAWEDLCRIKLVRRGEGAL